MRCPKCGYISFDRVTSCLKCEADVTELASSLNGTGFQPMNNFFLGTLLPDYLNTMADGASSSFQDAADDLDISMEDLDNLGDIGSIPGEGDDFDLGLGAVENDNTISLQGVVVPEVDLSDFDDGELEDVDTMQISGAQLDGMNAEAGEGDEQVDLSDIPDFSLEGVDLDEEAEDDSADISFSGDEVDDLAAEDEDLPGLDLQMEEEEVEVGDEATMILNVDDLDLATDDDETIDASLDLSDIDLSLGEEDGGEVSDLADLDLGDLEMEAEGEKKENDFPDLDL